MYQSYFDKFLSMTPYLEISTDEWQYIKKTFSVDDIKESMATVCMTYPIPYNDISEEDAYTSYMQLKSVRWNDGIKEQEWFSRTKNSNYSLLFENNPMLFSKSNTGNAASNYFQQENRWKAN